MQSVHTSVHTAAQTRRLVAALDCPAEAAPVARLPWETNGYMQQPTTRR